MTKVRAETLYRGQVLRLTLNAPPGNLLDDGMVEDLHRALPERAGDLKLILLSAEGPDFSVGGRLDSARYHEVYFRLIDLGLPTVAMVRGRCLGAALELGAFCNFIFAAGTA